MDSYFRGSFEIAPGLCVNVRAALTATFLMLLLGCATQQPMMRNQTIHSYTIGETKTVSPGEPFLVNQNGRIETQREWVGILFSPDGWKYTDRYSADFIRQELLYGGKSGNTIDVSYREFRGGLAAQAFTQNLHYDLNESKFITFQKFQIEILSATNQFITYRIVKD